MKIIKRNGAEEVFDIKKIVIAVTKADSSSEGRSLTDSQIEDIAEFVEFKCNKLNRAVSVEEIQDLVEDQIMATGAFELAKRLLSAITKMSNRKIPIKIRRSTACSEIIWQERSAVT